MKRIHKNWNKQKGKAGIYKITCTGNNKFYIGSSMDIQYRWIVHISLLRRGNHSSSYLQRSYNKYGEESLKFEVIQYVDTKDKELLVMVEFYYIDKLKPEFNTIGPVVLERNQEWKNKIAESTRRLYTDDGYINPRKGVGQRYDLYDMFGNLVHSNLTCPEICDSTHHVSYHTINSSLRRFGGVCCIYNPNYLICKTGMNWNDIISAIKQHKEMVFKFKVCDLNGNIFTDRTPTKKTQFLTVALLKDLIFDSDNFYYVFNKKIFSYIFQN